MNYKPVYRTAPATPGLLKDNAPEPNLSLGTFRKIIIQFWIYAELNHF